MLGWGREKMLLLHCEKDNQALHRGNQLLQWLGDVLLLLVGRMPGPVPDHHSPDLTPVIGVGGEDSGQAVCGLGDLAEVPHQNNVSNSDISVVGLPAGEGDQAGPDCREPGVPPVLVTLLDVPEPQREAGHELVEVLAVLLGSAGPASLEKEVGSNDTDVWTPFLVVPDSQRPLIDLICCPGKEAG